MFQYIERSIYTSILKALSISAFALALVLLGVYMHKEQVLTVVRGGTKHHV